MTKRNNSIVLSRGDSAILTHTVSDINGSAVDLSASTVYFTVKTDNTLDDPDATIQKTADLTDPVNGSCVFSLSPSDTDITIREYYYDIEVAFSDTDKRTSDSGTFEILQDVTKS